MQYFLGLLPDMKTEAVIYLHFSAVMLCLFNDTVVFQIIWH